MVFNLFFRVFQCCVFVLMAFWGQLVLAVTEPLQFNVIHLGIYAPFSEEKAYIGRNILAAVELAREDIQSSHLIYSIYTLDKLSDSVHAREVLQRFITTNQIQVLFTASVEEGHVASVLAQKSNVLHINISEDRSIADGLHNVMLENSHTLTPEILAQTMNSGFVAKYRQDYMSSPRSEAGYAFDVFHILNKGVLASLSTAPDFSASQVAHEMLAQKHVKGVMGAFDLNQRGVWVARSSKMGTHSLG